jgi:hypothetical protein
MSNASNSQGVRIMRGDIAPGGLFTAVAEVKDWNGPKGTAKDIDVTSMDSTAKESRPGLVDYGEISLNGQYVGDDVTHQGLDDDLANRVVRYWELQLADTDATHTTPTSWVFQGYVKAFDIKGGVDKVVDFSSTIKITGKPVRTARA